MTFKKLFNQYALLWGMLLGILGYKWLYHLSPMLPYLLFVMLLFSYTKVAPRDLKPKKIHYALLATQWSLGLLIYIVLTPLDVYLAQGLALLVITPTAISAPVITSMLGGSAGFIVSYLIPSNLLIVIFAPLLIGWLYPDVVAGSYMTTVWHILSQVTTLLILPLTIVWLLRYFAPKVHRVMYDHAKISFYAWVLLVVVVMATATHTFVHDDQLAPRALIILAVATLLLALLLFGIGGLFARKYNELHANGRQAFGQKNTVLAIWMAMTFMDPRVSLVPLAYLVWQNVINSFELVQYQRKDGKDK